MSMYHVGDVVVLRTTCPHNTVANGQMFNLYGGRQMTVSNVYEVSDGYTPYQFAEAENYYWDDNCIDHLVRRADGSVPEIVPQTQAEVVVKIDVDDSRFKYKVGDVVCIDIHKREHTAWNPEGNMNKWHGMAMTIRDRQIDAFTNEPVYFMVEDQQERRGMGWVWRENMLAGFDSECGDFLRSKLIAYNKVKTVKKDKYEVGDLVRIVPVRTGPNWNDKGRMDKWCGKLMTVRAVDEWTPNNPSYKMWEDREEHGGGWFWNNHMIEGAVVSDDATFLDEVLPENTALDDSKGLYKTWPSMASSVQVFKSGQLVKFMFEGKMTYGIVRGFFMQERYNKIDDYAVEVIDVRGRYCHNCEGLVPNRNGRWVNVNDLKSVDMVYGIDDEGKLTVVIDGKIGYAHAREDGIQTVIGLLMKAITRSEFFMLGEGDYATITNSGAIYSANTDWVMRNVPYNVGIYYDVFGTISNGTVVQIVKIAKHQDGYKDICAVRTQNGKLYVIDRTALKPASDEERTNFRCRVMF